MKTYHLELVMDREDNDTLVYTTTIDALSFEDAIKQARYYLSVEFNSQFANKFFPTEDCQESYLEEIKPMSGPEAVDYVMKRC